ncbi:MAG: hypothetical protein WCI74_12920, partial [Actinomycetes bacterium]
NTPLIRPTTATATIDHCHEQVLGMRIGQRTIAIPIWVSSSGRSIGPFADRRAPTARHRRIGGQIVTARRGIRRAAPVATCAVTAAAAMGLLVPLAQSQAKTPSPSPSASKSGSAKPTTKPGASPSGSPTTGKPSPSTSKKPGPTPTGTKKPSPTAYAPWFPASVPTIGTTEPDITTPGQWAIAILHAGNWPVTGENVCALTGWQNAEGGHFTAHGARYNPLNTSMPAPGDSVFNSVGVRNYPNWLVGISATIRTLNMGFYSGIRANLANGHNPVGVLVAVDASPWGTKADNPASWLNGSCQGWAAEFNAKHGQLQASIDTAKKSRDSAQAKYDAALASQRQLEAKHQKMSQAINEAQQRLDRFAYSVYVTGMDPSMATEVQTFTSSDPISFIRAKQYVDRAGDSDSNAMQRALELLSEVSSSRQLANAALSAANGVLGERQKELDRAEQQMTDFEHSAI